MKVLWLVNIVVPEIAGQLGIARAVSGGWISSQIEEMRSINNVHLTVATTSSECGEDIFLESGGVEYAIFSVREGTCVDRFERFISELLPEIIHIWGTEMPRNQELALICPPDKTILSMQGIISKIAEVYSESLPAYYRKKHLVPQIMVRYHHADTIYNNQQALLQSAVVEKEIISRLKYFIGRTEFDKTFIRGINSEAEYFHCGECLNQLFYLSPKWELNNCERHSIYVSQGHYPVKGLHLLLKSLPLIINQYHDVHLYVGGDPITTHNNAVKRAISNYLYEYNGLINRQIQKYGLKHHVTFTGRLSSSEVKEHLLKANVFVSASSCENSSNSVGEALLTGTPIVASDVGGIKDIVGNAAVYLYPYRDTSMLSNSIISAFESKGENEKSRIKEGEKFFNRNSSVTELLAIYKSVMS